MRTELEPKDVDGKLTLGRAIQPWQMQKGRRTQPVSFLEYFGIRLTLPAVIRCGLNSKIPLHYFLLSSQSTMHRIAKFDLGKATMNMSILALFSYAVAQRELRSKPYAELHKPLIQQPCWI